MTIKNVNSGFIQTDGGDAHIGDIHYHIDGLSELLHSYKAHLKTIEALLNSFKVRTALKSLEELERRISEAQVKNVQISSKILFLKACCKRELPEFSTDETSKEFIRAYRLNPLDDKIKKRACIEYLNIGENDKSLKIADEIFEKDEFDITYWYVKVFCSTDLESTISEIPNTVIENYSFQHVLIYHIIRNVKINFVEDLDKYGLKINVETHRYKELNFENKPLWILAIDLLINKIFNDTPIKYISGNDFIQDDNPLIKNAITLIGDFLNFLDDSEIKESINHHSFFFFYFKYLNSKDKELLNSLESNYYSLVDLNWSYTMAYCQVLNNAKKYRKSLKVIEEYEVKGKNIISEVFVFKATLLFLLKEENKVPSVFESYLKTVLIIDERIIFNILNTFFNALYKIDFEGGVKGLISKTLRNKFKNEELKIIFEVTARIRYFDDYDREVAYQKMSQTKAKDNFDYNCKNLIAENLDRLDRTDEAIIYMDSYIDKTTISESLRFFIILLNKQLYLNTESGRGIYKELLPLLKFFRINSVRPDIELLNIEHNLNAEKNDWHELRDIDFKLYECFPENDLYLFTYLLCLEKLNLNNELNQICKGIRNESYSETYGIQIAKLLLRNGLTKKGGKILYNLAFDITNTESRKYYFGMGIKFGDDFFKKYEEVKIGDWVKYSINSNQIEEIKITKTTGIQKSFIGKQINEKFTKLTELTGEIKTILIIDIYNDELKLNYDIQKEIQNPLNELGFTSLNFPEKIEDFENFMKKNFGAQGEEEKKYKDKKLNDYYNYRIGFTEIVKAVFRDNPIDAYYTLTGYKEHTFTAIPNLLVKDDSIDDEVDYVLDFTSLLLFFNIENDLGFKFNRKFTISYLLKELVSLFLIEEQNTPESPMSIQVNPNNIKRHLTPEGFKEKRVELFKSLILWIDQNCKIDLVEEKLDISFKLNKDGIDFDKSMKLLTDQMFFSNRDNTRLISNDSTLYLIQNGRGIYNNILSPEKYLLKHHPDKIDTEYFRYLMKSNYSGISINFDTLKNEFFDSIVGKENYYNQCLLNLQYSIHNDKSVIILISKFLREIYLINSILIESKNRYAFEVFRSTFYGMPKNIMYECEKLLKKDFVLLGNSYDHILNTYKEVRTLYFP